MAYHEYSTWKPALLLCAGPDYGESKPSAWPRRQTVNEDKVIEIIGNNVLVNSGSHMRKNFSKNHPRFWARTLTAVHKLCSRPQQQK